MLNMSPSCTSVLEMRLKRSRMRPVLRKSRCRSSTMIRKMRPAASLRGRDGGRMMPSCVGARRRRQQVVHAAAVHERERRHVLLHAIFEDLEIVLASGRRRIGPALLRTMTSMLTRSMATLKSGVAARWSAVGRLRRRGLRGLPSRRLSARTERQRLSSQNQTRTETNSLDVA